MASDIKLKRGNVANLITTGGAPGNAILAAGSVSALSAEYDNSGSLMPYGDMEIGVTFGTAPTAGKAVEFYLIPCNDGTNYTDTGAGTAPADNLLVAWTYVRASTVAHRLTARPAYGGRIELPPCKFKIAVKNAADQGFSANWTVDLYPYLWQST